MLTQQEISQIKQALEAKREELMAEIKAESTPNNPGNDTTKTGDEEANETENFVDQLAVAQTQRGTIQEIDSSLERIRNGSYGICVRCGKEIAKEILDIAPESSLCENCKLETA